MEIDSVPTEGKINPKYVWRDQIGPDPVMTFLDPDGKHLSSFDEMMEGFWSPGGLQRAQEALKKSIQNWISKQIELKWDPAATTGDGSMSLAPYLQLRFMYETLPWLLNLEEDMDFKKKLFTKSAKFFKYQANYLKKIQEDPDGEVSSEEDMSDTYAY